MGLIRLATLLLIILHVLVTMKWRDSGDLSTPLPRLYILYAEDQ